MQTASDIHFGKARSTRGFNPAAARLAGEHDSGHTIIGVPFETPHPLRSMLLEPEVASVVPDVGLGQRLFKIRAADSNGHRSSASILLDRMYASRGYRTNGLPPKAPNRITLMACEHDEAMGTITVGFDSPAGLHVDELFRDEVDALRAQGRRVCEFTKLAMDSLVRSKRVLASLFHTAYIYAYRINRFQDLLIEVNPRHVRYYERMLGFVAKGPQKLCPRVDAPAVLMALDLSYAHEQIARFGGRQDLADTERSLYPYFFSVQEEAGIVGRLRRGSN